MSGFSLENNHLPNNPQNLWITLWIRRLYTPHATLPSPGRWIGQKLANPQSDRKTTSYVISPTPLAGGLTLTLSQTGIYDACA
jgi:hypothetical protein